jgi:uncharacterized protein (TIGR03382 family)
MRRTILGGLFTLLLAAPALGAPIGSSYKWDDQRTAENLTIKGADWYACNAGDAGSLLVAAATAGLLARRRR